MIIVKVLWSRSHYYVKKTTTAIAAASATLKDKKEANLYITAHRTKGEEEVEEVEIETKEATAIW